MLFLPLGFLQRPPEAGGVYCLTFVPYFLNTKTTWTDRKILYCVSKYCLTNTFKAFFVFIFERFYLLCRCKCAKTKEGLKIVRCKHFFLVIFFHVCQQNGHLQHFCPARISKNPF